MTFDLSVDHQRARDNARAFAQEAVQPRAAEIDRTSAVPRELIASAVALVTAAADPLMLVLTIEELSVASAAVGVAAAADVRHRAPPPDLSGLKGAPPLPNVAQSQLVLAAVALGLGRAALDLALAHLRRAAMTPGDDVERPHWVVADAATELEAARLLLYKAALNHVKRSGETDIAIARLMASAAARHVVDAALRVVGPSGLQEGTELERLSRDVRAVSLLMGTEEHQRAKAATGLFPV